MRCLTAYLVFCFCEDEDMKKTNICWKKFKDWKWHFAKGAGWYLGSFDFLPEWIVQAGAQCDNAPHHGSIQHCRGLQIANQRLLIADLRIPLCKKGVSSRPKGGLPDWVRRACPNGFIQAGISRGTSCLFRHGSIQHSLRRATHHDPHAHNAANEPAGDLW